MESLTLPPAAKTQKETASNTKSYGALQESSSKPSQDVSPNDRSPLLEVHPQQKISDNSDHKGNTSSFSSSIRNNLDFKSIVHRISSVNGNAKKINRALSDTGLDLITSAEQVDFTAWLDEQFKKIDSFYKEKEKEAVERYLMLQDQLFNLREQKISARVAKAQAKPSKIKIPSNTTATKTKKKIAHNIDLPSLPASIRDALFAQTKKDHDKQSGLEEESAEEGEEISRDYVKHNKDDNHIPYPVARRQIKIAIGEFYRSLELLKSYRTLNQTAFRKMTKKFDKMTGRSLQKPYMEKVNSSYFCQSEIVDDLIRKTEDMFAMYFENGNHKHAVEKLRAKSVPEDHYIAMFITGLSYGLSAPLLIQAVVKGVDRIHEDDPDALFLFQIWGGFFLVLLMLALFQINCLIWKLYKINYPFIFEFHPLSHLDAKEMAVVPSVLMFLLAILMWLCFYDFWPGVIDPIHYPPIFLGVAVLVFILPLPIIQPQARKWLMVASWRVVMSGFYPVEFRDFFLGDMFSSLTYSISNASFFFCLYATHWYGVTNGSHSGSSCGSSRSRILGFLNALPAIWRLLQCLRRYLDSGDWFPHLANMVKYGVSALYFAFLSAYRINLGSNSLRSLFLVFACINTIYSSFWDVFMDFSLMQDNSKNFLLRNELGFKVKWPYYATLVIDPILRCGWIFYAIYANQVQQSAKVSFFVALSEVFRRFIWAFFRVENEHCSNVQRFRASRDVSLPYQIVTRRAGTSVTTPELFRSSRVPTNDEEAQVPGIEVVSSENETTTATSGADASKTPKSTFSAIATPVIQALSFALRNAHTRDFQRRKDSVVSTESSSTRNKVDSDDDDSDDEEDDVNNENAEAASVSFGVNGPIYQHETSHSNGHRPSYFKQPSSVKWRDQYL